jgi:hypothetical protein
MNLTLEDDIWQNQMSNLQTKEEKRFLLLECFAWMNLVGFEGFCLHFIVGLYIHAQLTSIVFK